MLFIITIGVLSRGTTPRIILNRVQLIILYRKNHVEYQWTQKDREEQKVLQDDNNIIGKNKCIISAEQIIVLNMIIDN